MTRANNIKRELTAAELGPVTGDHDALDERQLNQVTGGLGLRKSSGTTIAGSMYFPDSVR